MAQTQLKKEKELQVEMVKKPWSIWSFFNFINNQLCQFISQITK